MSTSLESEIRSQLIHIGHILAQRGWLRATSGNLSIYDRLQQKLYITRSGVDKGRLEEKDILTLDDAGRILEGEGKPSFETLVHQTIYQHTEAGASLHVHTVHNNVVSKYAHDHYLHFSHHEMIKALGYWDEDACLDLPVVPNHAHIPALKAAVESALNPAVPGILVRNHGIYAFGESLDAALRHLEAFEFLFEWYLLDQLSETAVPIL